VHTHDEHERRYRDCGVVGRHHPGDAADGRVQLAVQLGQREHDDRGIGESNRDRGGEKCRQRQTPSPDPNLGGNRGRDAVHR
jgi:hypothetical protein